MYDPQPLSCKQIFKSLCLVTDCLKYIPGIAWHLLKPQASCGPSTIFIQKFSYLEDELVISLMITPGYSLIKVFKLSNSNKNHSKLWGYLCCERKTQQNNLACISEWNTKVFANIISEITWALVKVQSSSVNASPDCYDCSFSPFA